MHRNSSGNDCSAPTLMVRCVRAVWGEILNRRGAENVKRFYTEATEEKRRTQRRQRQKRPPEKQKQAAATNSKTKITEPARRRHYLVQALGLGLVRDVGGAALRVYLGLQRVVERGGVVGFCGAYLVGG